MFCISHSLAKRGQGSLQTKSAEHRLRETKADFDGERPLFDHFPHRAFILKENKNVLCTQHTEPCFPHDVSHLAIYCDDDVCTFYHNKHVLSLYNSIIAIVPS